MWIKRRILAQSCQSLWSSTVDDLDILTDDGSKDDDDDDIFTAGYVEAASNVLLPYWADL